jgi:hypothetical protein
MKAQHAHWWDPRTWLAFVFWELRSIFAVVGDRRQSEWKAILVMVAVEFFAIVGLTNAAAVYLDRRLIDKGSPFIFLVAFAVAIANTPAVLGKHRHWDRLSTEFEGYSTLTRVVGGIVVVLLVIGSVIVAGHFGAAQRSLPR